MAQQHKKCVTPNVPPGLLEVTFVNKTEIKEQASAAIFGQINTLKEQNRIYSHRLTIYGNTDCTIIKVIFLKSAENSKITHMSAESEK